MIIIFLIPFSIHSQNKVIGIVSDTLGPVEFANVVLSSLDGKIISGTITDERGYFEISADPGGYNLEISFVGYDKWTKEMELSKDFDHGRIVLKGVTELDEVVVQARKNIFEKKIDRLVFNVKNLPSVQGGDMLDVLNVTPRIRFRNDRISMIGKDDLKLMINGRITQLSGQSLVNLLNSISADDIERVEVITTPPANFSAEGNSGLINIVYKKGRKNSWSGTINTTYTQATYDREVIGANFDYNKDKLSFKSNINFVRGSRLITDSNTVFYSDQQWFSVAPRRVFYDPLLSGRIALDYQLSKRFMVGAQYFGNDNKLRIHQNEGTKIVNNGTSAIDSTIRTGSVSRSHTPSTALNFYSEYKLDTSGKKITLTLDYFSFKDAMNREFESRTFASDGTQTNGSFNAGDNIGLQRIKNYTGSIDVELPYEKINISFGGRLSSTRTDNDNTFFDLSGGTPVLNIALSNEFEFEEDTQAIYISASKSINKKWETKLGLRLENTQTIGFSVQLDQKNKNDYLRLFPSGYISYTMDDGHNLSFNISSRIRRPSFESLNPFRTIQNQYSFNEGNPELQPSFSDNIELTYTHKNKWINTLYYSSTKNGFSQVTLADEQTNIQQTVPLNYYGVHRIGLSESYSFSPFNWWESNNSLDFYYATSDSFVPNLDVNQWETSAYFQTNNNWTLDKKGNVSLNAAFWLQFPISGELYTTKQYNSLDLALRFSLLQKQLQVAITGTDVFSSQRPQYKEVSNNISVEYNQYYDNRSLRVSLSYSFGNSKIRVKQRKFGNEEEKQRTPN